MATTAEELRTHIEEYLNKRIRPKPKEDRTPRESLLLEVLARASEELLAQEHIKQSQVRATLEQLLDDKSEEQLATLLRISTAKKQLMRGLVNQEEGE